jgi:carbon-monoxide dehydrogenase small subunit
MSALQKNFVEAGAIQCGFCTPGVVLSATAMAEKKKSFTREEVRRELSGNLCRCTGYKKIVEAVEKSMK